MVLPRSMTHEHGRAVEITSTVMRICIRGHHFNVPIKYVEFPKEGSQLPISITSDATLSGSAPCTCPTTEVLVPPLCIPTRL